MLNFPTYERRVKREKYFATKARNKSKEKAARREAAKESSSE